MSELRHHNVLPTYRSLVNPSITYDYQTHRVIHLSPLDIKNIIARFQTIQLQKPKSAFQMKYRSLLSDVSMKAQILSRKVLNLKSGQQSRFSNLSKVDLGCRSFKDLPTEIQILIFDYVDDPESLRTCLYVSKKFYELAKPLLFASVSFTSTYRFAQFITCLRHNSALGPLVMDVDLSKIQPGNADVEENLQTPTYSSLQNTNTDDLGVYLSQVFAGWRDWKFKTNPCVLHPVAIPLSKCGTNNSTFTSGSNGSKRIKLTKYFKRRRSQTNVTIQNPQPVPSSTTSFEQNSVQKSTHPKINRFLLDYASSRDIPIGYLIHLINLCPNLRSLNLENLSISPDYRVKRAFQSRYQTYDILNNFPKDMLKIVDSMAPSNQGENPYTHRPGSRNGFTDIASSASSVFSFNAFQNPVPKYNSLLPPLHIVTPDLHYAKKGDGQVFLSDLSLKSMNPLHLEIVHHREIFRSLQKHKSNLCYLNMSSMIWLNLKLVRDFLSEMLALDLKRKMVDGKEVFTFKGKVFKVGESLVEDETRVTNSSRLVIDFRNSGMIKNLPWAQIIDTGARSGQKYVYRIMNNELVSAEDENIIRERNRRGRVGENYFS